MTNVEGLTLDVTTQEKRKEEKKNRDKEQGQISPLNLKKKIGNEETNSYSHGGGVVVDDCQCQWKSLVPPS